jgi:hypothetical protein
MPGGYPGYVRCDLVTARGTAGFFHFFQNKPAGLTAPHFELVPELVPDKTRGPVLATPILMLIDSIAWSAADYVPAMLQDNRRAVLFGENTAGAGGNQAHVGLGDACAEGRSRFGAECAPAEVIGALGTLGFRAFYYTTTIAVRPGDRVIENVGVSPDVPYRIQAADLLTSFAPMKRRILDTLQKLTEWTMGGRLDGIASDGLRVSHANRDNRATESSQHHLRIAVCGSGRRSSAVPRGRAMLRFVPALERRNDRLIVNATLRL